MPELLTRMDNAGWLTPSIAEVLDPLARPPYDDDFTGRQAGRIQKVLGELGVPVIVVGVGAMPSHTLFALQPEPAGRRGKRRAVTASDIRRHLNALATELDAEEIGLIDEMSRMPGAMGLLIRNSGHRRLQLRHLLMRPEFLENPSNTALALGMDMEQRCVVRDLVDLPHLLILGGAECRAGLIDSILVTFLLFNTPAEWRIAMIGTVGDGLARYKGVPHLLGRPVSSPADGRKLLDGLLREVERRRKLFEGRGVENLRAYNQAMFAQGEKVLPGILLVLDSVSGGGWAEQATLWTGVLANLLERGQSAGLHCIVTAESAEPPAFPSALSPLVPIRMACADVAGEFGRGESWPTGFVDAVLAEPGGQVTALQIGTVTGGEVGRVVDYWRRAMTHRRAGPESIPAEASAVMAEPSSASTSESDLTYERARALAAYLGWLSVGPLRDILGLSDDMARRILSRMQNEGVLEQGDGPVLRHRRIDGGPPGGGVR